jgi:hypothetical protein
MKKQIAIASAILAASSYSFAEIALTESLSVEGFVDMSWSDTSDAGVTGPASIGIDQVEFDFLFNTGAVSAQVDVEYEESGEGTNIEQAFVSYDLGNGAVVTAGRMASQLGFEDFEPTGLYQNSNAISTSNLPGYGQGVLVTYGDFGVAVLDGVNSGSIADGQGYTLEVAYSIELAEGLNGFLGAQINEDPNKAAGSDDLSILNAYVTYETGAWLFAAEIAKFNGATSAADATDYQLMANYSYNDKSSVTVRYAVNDLDTFDDDDKLDVPAGSAITVAHNYALADNLLVVAELTKFNPDDSSLSDALYSAVELLFTF